MPHESDPNLLFELALLRPVVAPGIAVLGFRVVPPRVEVVIGFSEPRQLGEEILEVHLIVAVFLATLVPFLTEPVDGDLFVVTRLVFQAKSVAENCVH